MSQTPSLKRKQQTISSFFTKTVTSPSSNGSTTEQRKGKVNTSNKSTPEIPARAKSRPPPRGKSNGREQGVEEDDDEDEDILPVKKRIRSSAWKPPEKEAEKSITGDSHAEEEEVEEVEEDGEEIRPSSPIQNAEPQSSASRAEKFRFQSSSAQPPIDEQISPAERKRKDQLHQKFVRRLGGPDCLPALSSHDGNSEADPTVEGTASDEEEGPSPPPQPKGKSAKKVGGSKLTPMEKQIIEIKNKHLDAVLLIQVGYKYQFYGEDARIAAKVLSIVCIPGKLRFDEHPSEAHLTRFASASVPIHRLHVHVKRLVAAGYKVGVVKQLETAALKAAGDNRNAPFVRKLTNMYTKATYIEDDAELELSGSLEPSTGYLLCLTESGAKGQGDGEKVQIGIVAVQPATGNVIHDSFEDGFMRSEIETRLLHIAPCELLLVGELSSATNKLVQHLSKGRMTTFGDSVRIERREKTKTAAAEAHSHISSFYAGKMAATGAPEDTKSSTLLDQVLQLPDDVSVCLSAMIKHLTEYGLEHVFDLTKYFQSFSARSHMMLNGNTLTNLEIYQNQSDYSSKGSLFWSMNRTRTKFGQRLLRRWVGRPLLDKAKLEERTEAVTELLDSDKSTLTYNLGSTLTQVKIDLEKALIRVYYGKCTRPELLTMLKSMQSIAMSFAHVKSPADTGYSSPILSESIAILPTMHDDVVSYLNKINETAAKKDDKYDFFRESEESEEIGEHRLMIGTIEYELKDHLKSIAETLGKKKVQYVSVAGIDYLVEVENSQGALKKVPASWRKISGTKKVSRFHTPEVVKMMRERDQQKESLAAACDTAFLRLLSDISTKYQLFRDCIQALATIDALHSLSVIAAQPGYVKPKYTDDTIINISQGRHPMVEKILIDSYVPNDTQLSTDETRALLVTGPNMGGKSSYVRQIALICIMGQIGSYVPAESATLGMLDAVYTRMGAFDNMLAGESTFMVELSETADILKQATPRSLVILDELGRGTSTHDGVAIAQAVLDYMVRNLRSLTLFITHYQNLSRLASAFPGGELRNVHMKFTETGDQGQDITFLYEIGEGVAHRSYGLNVAKLANIPAGILEVAQVKSEELEAKISRKKMGGMLQGIFQALSDQNTSDSTEEQVERLLHDIELL
ncbi:DNA mismatch repair protein Msh3 [Nannizzia gypsea CBS 118893]|uniref:DNA mismatch repair protein MSH3 n=1 Tax=Arthroderma gypseum (strain ATCC MYA-4604 / CBS 118893) TaxID=535722 RepID=E4UVM5_ARTGP|nr:DNA mismatch repair protein Msh3 [Nannizzia gypsea CBS 118893]EFR02352.1 DNA mismatch repair protein Msh3 [Nannizzia gypsea CBS 118893]